jgi:hypothetical protein
MPNRDTRTPRQKALDGSAKTLGRDAAGFSDGDSYQMLQQRKALVSDTAKRSAPLDINGFASRTASRDEAGRFRSLMDAEYAAEKNRRLREKNMPTGYDAAMRPATKPTPPILKILKASKR